MQIVCIYIFIVENKVYDVDFQLILGLQGEFNRIAQSILNRKNFSIQFQIFLKGKTDCIIIILSLFLISYKFTGFSQLFDLIYLHNNQKQHFYLITFSNCIHVIYIYITNCISLHLKLMKSELSILLN